MSWYNTIDDSSVFIQYKQNNDESKRCLQLINMCMFYACLYVYIPIWDYSAIWICTDNLCENLIQFLLFKYFTTDNIYIRIAV
jgi:hypothetical protein